MKISNKQKRKIEGKRILWLFLCLLLFLFEIFHSAPHITSLLATIHLQGRPVCVHRQVVSSLILFYFCVVCLSRFQKKMHSFSYAAAAWTPVQTTKRHKETGSGHAGVWQALFFCLLCYSSSWLENLETKSSRQGQPGALLMRWRAGFSRYDGISIRPTCGV